MSSILSRIRAHQRALLGSRRKSALYDLHPDLAQRIPFYSSSAQFAAGEADNYVGAATLYRSYVWVRKAIMLYAQTLAPLPVRAIDRDGKPIVDHPLTRLYAAPNDRMPASRYWAILSTHKLLGGERFSEVVSDPRGRPVELWPRRPDRVQIAPDDARPGYPAVATYHLDELPDGQQDLPPESVIHEWFVNPLSEWRGLGPIAAVLMGIAIDRAAQAQARDFYRNQARPDYAITVKDIQTKDERTRLETQIDEKYGAGGYRTNKPIVLESGQDIRVLSFPQRDLEGIEQRQVSRDEVAAIFGVPDILMGFGNDSYDTEEKRDAALAVFWALALLPAVLERDETETHFWRTVRPILRPGERVGTDLSGVAALQEKLGPKLENAKALWGMGAPFDVIDQVLRLGVGAIPGGSTGYLPLSLIPVADAGAPPPPAQQRALAGAAARTNAERTGEALRRIRLQVAAPMERALGDYFRALATRVEARACEQAGGGVRRNGHSLAVLAKEITIEGLLLPEDDALLLILLKQYTVEIARASWDTWNAALGLSVVFAETDPAVVAALAHAGERIGDISETTRQALVAYLQASADQDTETLAAGLGDVLRGASEGRARTIARTELGYAQATAAAERYAAAGVSQVLIFDNGLEDSDPVCTTLNGTVQTLDWYRRNPLQHPNCLRAAGPYYS